MIDLGQDPADLVVEDLGRGAGDGVQAGVLPCWSQSRKLRFAFDTPFMISIGENACTGMSGTRLRADRTVCRTSSRVR